MSAYADDVIVMISRQGDIRTLLKLLSAFRGVSSASVNWRKSEALLLGKWIEGKPELPEGLVWGTSGLKYLGVFLGDDLTVQKIGKGSLRKLKVSLEKWQMFIPKDVVQRPLFNS